MADEELTGPAETVTSAPAPTSTDWTSAIPPEYAHEKLWEPLKGKGLPDVLKNYAEAQKYIGGAVRRPADDAPPEEWQAFHRKMGVPESPDQYPITPPTLPEEHGLTWDEAAAGEFVAVAHANGMTPQQVQGMLDWYAQYVVSSLDKQTEQTANAQKAAVAELEKEWGPRAGATFQRNIEFAKKAVVRIFEGDPDLLELAEAQGNDPLWVKGLAIIGQKMLESGEITSDIMPSDQASIDARIQDITSQLLKGPLTGAARQRLLDERQELYRQRPGGREAVVTL